MKQRCTTTVCIVQLPFIMPPGVCCSTGNCCTSSKWVINAAPQTLACNLETRWEINETQKSLQTMQFHKQDPWLLPEGRKHTENVLNKLPTYAQSNYHYNLLSGPQPIFSNVFLYFFLARSSILWRMRFEFDYCHIDLIIHIKKCTI